MLVTGQGVPWACAEPTPLPVARESAGDVFHWGWDTELLAPWDHYRALGRCSRSRVPLPHHWPPSELRARFGFKPLIGFSHIPAPYFTPLFEKPPVLEAGGG